MISAFAYLLLAWALPLTSDRQIYRGPIQFQLLDPNGFRIFNKTNNGNLHYDNDDSLELEENDEVNSLSDNNENKKLPKFHVFMTFEEVSDSPFSLNVDIFARFAHGMKVKGELTLRCLPVDKETSNENDNKEASSTARKILSTQLLEGHWSGKLDLKVCGVTEEKHQKIKLIAEVTERGSFLSAKTVKEWD
uniref:Macroglobulin domain-containing protein n=1 Tax=Meloidogyne javanica TaxID=6303 RepID=A0A915MT86_MELJA